MIRAGWIFANLVPIVFLLCLFALIFFAAPEHDDFCFAYLNVHDGFVQTVIGFYYGMSARIVPFLLIQLPGAMSAAAGISILSAYSMTLVACMVVFMAGTAFAVVRAWPDRSGPSVLFLSLAFPAAVLGATPSVHDLLYWLPAVACYIPPALVSILILGECVRALDRATGFSRLATLNMAIAGFIAAICNEFTGIWLVGMLAGSLLARRTFGQKLQIKHHLLIAALVLIGWTFVVMAPGNSVRMATNSGTGLIGHSLYASLRFSLIGLGRFLREPAVIGWLAVAAIATLAAEPTRPAHPRGRLLALGIAALCLACCYFEYFAHEFSTGVRIVERAQNQALILLLFGLTLSVSLLVRAYRPQLRQRFMAAGLRLAVNSAVLPTSLAMLMVASLGLSSTSLRVLSERESFYPFWRESVARDRLLATSPEAIVTVRKHTWTPSTLTSSDVTDNIGCIAAYYHKSAIIPAEAEGR